MRRFVLFLLQALIFLFPLKAHTPILNLVDPRGGKMGEDTVVNLYGDRLFEPQEIIFYQPGITVRQLEKVNDKHVKAHLTIAPDAALGEHKLRLRCKGGITYLRTLLGWAIPRGFRSSIERQQEGPQRHFRSSSGSPF